VRYLVQQAIPAFRARSGSGESETGRRRQSPLPGEFRGGLGVTVRPMSDGELSRLEVLRHLDHRRLTIQAAAGLLRLSAVRCSGC
jgi:hypothetical protein